MSPLAKTMILAACSALAFGVGLGLVSSCRSARIEATEETAHPEPRFLSPRQKERIDPELLPLCEEFVQRMNKKRLSLEGIERLGEVRVLPREEFDKEMKEVKEKDSAMAVAMIPRDRSLPIDVYFVDEVLNTPSELKGLVYHEMLHVIGYGHPSRPCSWSLDERYFCGITGASSGAGKISLKDVERIIEKTLSKKELGKLPRLAFPDEQE